MARPHPSFGAGLGYWRPPSARYTGRMQAAAASTLFVGSVMLAIGVARGTLELLFWGCRAARLQMIHEPETEALPVSHDTYPQN